MIPHRASVAAWLTLCLAASVSWLAGPTIAAEGRVEFELSADPGVPVNSSQDWYRLLVDLKVANLRIQSNSGAVEPKINVLGTGASPTYQVQGVLTARGELLVPGGRFTLRDSSKLEQWLTNLRTNGPSLRAPKAGPFGLTREQLAQAHAALSQPLGFATKGLSHSQAVSLARQRVKLPLVIDVKGGEAAAGEQPVTEELQALTCGTALAYLLRPGGLGISPQLGSRGELEFVIRRAAKEAESWPVGWPVGTARPLPALFDMITIELDDVTLAETLTAIEDRLKTPILFDRFALVRFGIDPESVRVNLPELKTSYSVLLQKILFQAQLKFELRSDESGKPLLWVTSMKSAGR